MSLGLLIPPIREAFEELQTYRQAFKFVPPGHFYSPMPSLDDVNRDAARLFGPPSRTIAGIELNEVKQLAWISTERN